MSCKFKEIKNQADKQFLKGSFNVANDTVRGLIDRVATHMLNKKVEEKSKAFLKNKIIELEVDSVKQMYQTRPIMENNLVEQLSPRNGIRECMRPMSANVRYEPVKLNSKKCVDSSKKSIISRGSFGSVTRLRPSTASTTSLMEIYNKKSKYQQRPHTSNQKKFFAINTFKFNDDSVDQTFIEQLRAKKVQEQEQIKKKQQFLKSIEFQQKNFSQSQAKFMQSMSRKKFIYGQQGQIIQLGKNTGDGNNLKKISAISKSRVQVKQKSVNEIKRLQSQMKENIYIQFKGREGFESRPQTANNKQGLGQDKIKQKLPTVETAHNLEPAKQLVRSSNMLTINNLLRPTTGKSQVRKSQTSLKNIPKSIKNLQNSQGFMSEMQFNENDIYGAQSKKKMEKIYFYVSPNSVYKVIDDFEGVDDVVNIDDSFN